MVRREELRRRVEALPEEVATWQQRTQNDLDSNAHFSQLQAIGIVMDVFAERQGELLGALDPTGDPKAFQDAALELVGSIIRAQGVWDFFRDKLDLRFSPTFKDVLWVADTVSWDCHRPILDQAADLGIVERATLREPPLTYLTAEFSPATWVRGSRPNDGRNYHLGTASLPIPVIELPWDHVENIWEFLTLHHEVGHDLEADLKLRGPLASALQTELVSAGVPTARVDQWLAWQGEVFADLVGLQLGGPAFAEVLMHLLLLPAAMVTKLNPDDPHPTHYPRILMNTAYIPTMISNHQPLAEHGQQIAAEWIALYGEQAQFAPVIQDFPVVFRALMDTPVPALQGRTVRELMPYTAADDARIRGAVGFLRTGMNRPSDLRPRHCVSAARLAITQAAEEGTLTPELLTEINQRTMELVRANAPGGLRGDGGSTAHRAFIASFVDTISLPGRP
jgi:hypothetical protein